GRTPEPYPAASRTFRRAGISCTRDPCPASRRRSYRLREVGLGAAKERDCEDEHREGHTRRIEKPRRAWHPLAEDRGTHAFEQRRDGIEHQPVLPPAQQPRLVHDRREENRERDHYFDDVLHVAEKERSGREQNREPRGKNDQNAEQQWNP